MSTHKATTYVFIGRQLPRSSGLLDGNCVYHESCLYLFLKMFSTFQIQSQDKATKEKRKKTDTS